MRGRGPAAFLATAAALVGVMTAAVVGDAILSARSAVLVDTPVIMGSVDTEDLTPPLPEDESAATSAASAPAGTAAQAEAAITSALAPSAEPTNATASPEIKYTRVARPAVTGPRRVGIQAGHWLTSEAPPELWRLVSQTGTTWQGVKEVDINLDIAKRIKAILEAKGIVVDVLPTTIPPGYLADAFVSLHGDGDGTGASTGFKMAYATRRTPYEQDLLFAIKETYKKATELDYDPVHVSRGMLAYYGMSWQRFRNSTAPHTPSVILEMGYVSNDHDRELMTERADVVASGIAQGILRFLDDHPREKLFGQDLLVPAFPAFPPARPPAP